MANTISGKVSSQVIFVACMFLVAATNQVMAQYRKPIRDISVAIENEYSMLKDSFSTNKRLPAPYEKQALFALSYFPEFKKTKIKFVLRTGKHGIISTRPTVGSIFRRSSRRTYKIFIEEPGEGDTRKFSFRYGDVNGQTGIIGHELCHILYFNRHSGIGLLRLAVSHLSRKYMDRFEYNTDSVAVVRGFGFQLIAWNVFLRSAFGMKDPENGPDPFFASSGRERYMSIPTLKRVMRKQGSYEEVR